MPEEPADRSSGESVMDSTRTVGPPRYEELSEEPLGGLQGEKRSPDLGTAARDLPPEVPESAQTDESQTRTTH